MIITSINNDRIKNLSKLKQKKYRDQDKLFLVEGDHLVEEALKSGYLKELIVLDENTNPFAFDNITYVSKEVMDKLSEQESSTNIIGVCSYIDNLQSELSNKLMLLDGLQDPGNVGTIIRSASAFGFDVVLGDNTVDIYNSKTIRSTEGMIFNIKFVKDNLSNFISKNNKYKYFIADMHKGLSVKEYNSDQPIAIIMGNEGNGVSQDIRDLNLEYIHINQNSKCESLNVGVASSIFMYELGDTDER